MTKTARMHGVVTGLFILLAAANGQTASASGERIDVDAIRTGVTARGGSGFQVGENWLTKLPKEQLKRMMGVMDPALVAGDDTSFEIPATPVRDRETFDWRNKDGLNWVSPILNQANCGSCVAFASVGNLETQFNISSGIPGLNPAFSTQALFACGGGACEFGWQPGLAARYLMQKGAVDESCAPYTMGATGETSSCSMCSDAAARTTKIAKYTTPSNGVMSVDTIKAALRNGPLVTTLTVYEDFVTYTSGVYKHKLGSALGGHAVGIVGFIDADRAWIVRNSWGADWGENGFIRMSWDDTSGIGNSTWAYTLTKPDGFLYLKNPTHHAYGMGSMPFHAASTYADTTQINFMVTNMATKEVTRLGCETGSDCSVMFDSAAMADGKYDAVATAKWGQTKMATSEHETFYVLNHQPTMSLSYTGHDVISPSRSRAARCSTSWRTRRRSHSRLWISRCSTWKASRSTASTRTSCSPR